MSTSAGRAWWVLHVDLDEFVAAVEILRRPELSGRPVVVGGQGDPTQRAVVATASYEAREFGVQSGMPLRLAARRCPDAVFLPVDGPVYEAVSEHVMATLRDAVGTDPELAAVVEVMGWDEAFVGLRTDDPERVARAVQESIRAQTRLSSTVGIGDNKLRAKIATGFGKPHGVYRLTETNWYAVMGERPTDALWGIGRKTARKLAELGLHTVRDLAAADPHELGRRLGGRMGPWYWTLGIGESSSEVSGSPYVPRSRSRETTFQHNIEDWSGVRQEIRRLAQRVAVDVEEEGRPAARVGVKVRFAPFLTQTRSVTLTAPTSAAELIEEGALAALAKFETERPVRLLGVRAEFVEPLTTEESPGHDDSRSDRRSRGDVE